MTARFYNGLPYGWPTRVCGKAKYLVGIFAVLLAILVSSPCAALSEGIESFPPATPAETARWVKLLGLESDAGVRIKSITLTLHDATVSITRVENAACIEDVCPTFFEYQLDRAFEFIIPCKERLLLLDVPQRDANGHVVSFYLDVGKSLTTNVRPTSLGPVITTRRRIF
jgi:hypothetical protein